MQPTMPAIKATMIKKMLAVAMSRCLLEPTAMLVFTSCALCTAIGEATSAQSGGDPARRETELTHFSPNFFRPWLQINCGAIQGR